MKMKNSIKVAIKVVLSIVLAVLLIILLTPVQGKGGSKEYKLGPIDKDSNSKICPLIKEGDTLLIDSPGGDVLPAILIAECTSNKNIKIKVKRADSAATFIVLASKNVCLMSSESTLGFHTPMYALPGGKYVEPDLKKLRRFISLTVQYYKEWGYNHYQISAIIGITMYTPSSQISTLAEEDLKRLLKYRLKGICT